MDDMNAFEAQVGREVVLAMGPLRPVDDAAIFTAITATRSPTWRVQSMFSATKLVVAAVIVALFGGLLLAGVLTPPRGDETAPAAGTDPLSGLVTEEVTPGVLRVVRDDAGHDLASLGVFEIAVGPDGAVWLDGRGGLFRLREPGIADSPSNGLRTELTVGPDGSVWSRAAWQRRDRSIRSFDGERWVYHPGPTVDTGVLRNDQLGPVFAIGPDGSVWAAWVNAEQPKPPGFKLARLEGGQWVGVDLAAWPDDLVGNANAAYGPGLVATDDGSLWMIAYDGDYQNVLARFDGREWDFTAIPGQVFNALDLAAGPDGSIWLFGTEGQSTARLAKHTDGAWTVVETPPDIRPDTGYSAEDGLRPVVTSDGAVWIRRKGDTESLSQFDCDGLLRYDDTWTGYLADHCIHSVAAGPGGEVWVVTGPIDEQSGEPTDTDVYLIDPTTSVAADG
jgi:hypothetical protein